MFSTVLGQGGSDAVPLFEHSSGDAGVFGNGHGLAAGEEGNAGGVADDSSSSNKRNNSASASGNSLSLDDQLQLWNMFLEAESSMGISTIKRLNTIRDCRDKCLLALEEKTASQVQSKALSQAAFGADISIRIPSLFDVPSQLVQRHCSRGFLSDTDSSSYERCRGRSTIGENSRDSGTHDNKTRSTSMGVPAVLQALINKLPPLAVGAAEPDVEAQLRQLKTMTLPPRPQVESEEGNAPISGTKRAADWLAQNGTGSGAGGAGDGIDYEEEEDKTVRDDVFRQRQRARRA